jgi:hypothetical protein
MNVCVINFSETLDLRVHYWLLLLIETLYCVKIKAKYSLICIIYLQILPKF